MCAAFKASVKCFSCKLGTISGLGSLEWLEAGRTFVHLFYACFVYLWLCTPVNLWSDRIWERLKLLLRLTRLCMKSIPVSSWCIFPQANMTKGEERQTGRLPCPASEQVNDKSVSPLWTSFVGWVPQEGPKMSAWGKQIICKTERFCKHWEGCSATRHV